MGTGKSTLGRHVSAKLNVPFLDTDEMIESQTGMSIARFFATSGEKEFREIEAGILRQTNIYDQALIATGGGLPCHFESMQWMNDHGITIQLAWNIKLLKSNLLHQTSSRPLLQNLDPKDRDIKIDLLLEERMPYYEMSSMTIEMSGDLEQDKLLLEKACKYIW